MLGHEAAHDVARHSAEGVGLRLLLGGVCWFICEIVSRLFSEAQLNALYASLPPMLRCT